LYKHNLALGYSATTTRRTEEILVTSPKARVPGGLLHQRGGARSGKREPSLRLGVALFHVTENYRA